jgi:hypothetical protein
MINKHGQRALEMTRVHDEHPVQTFGSDGSDEPFRDPIGLRRLNRCANDSGPLGCEHRIEAVRKLAIVIANQKADRRFALGERPCDLSRLLRHPFPVGIRRAAAEVHAAAPDFNEEQHVRSLEPDRLDTEEVHGHHAVRMGAEELPP